MYNRSIGCNTYSYQVRWIRRLYTIAFNNNMLHKNQGDVLVNKNTKMGFMVWA